MDTEKQLIPLQKLTAKYGVDAVIECCASNCIRPKVIMRQISLNPRPLNEKERRSVYLNPIFDLFKACRDVLIESIKAGGTTFYDFRNAGGGKGNFFKKLKVFQREGKKCYRCKGDIVKGRVAVRGTHWCSSCQV